jgi:hypothetical protein
MTQINVSPTAKRDIRQPLLRDTVMLASWSCVAVDPPNAKPGTISNQVITAGFTQARLSKLTLGVRYLLNCHIVGSSGQEYDSYATVTCLQQ